MRLHLALALCAASLSGCASPERARTGTYVPPLGVSYVDLEFSGQLLVTAPLWLGAEGGSQPHVYLTATDEQFGKLREQFRWLAVGLGGVEPTRFPDWERTAWDLDAQHFQRAIRFYLSGEPLTREKLFPIHVVGVGRDGKSTLILAVPLR